MVIENNKSKNLQRRTMRKMGVRASGGRYCIKERQRENGRESERSKQCFKLSLNDWLY